MEQVSSSSFSSSRVDHFLHATVKWLHWSVMDEHWKNKCEHPYQEKESVPKKVFRLTFAYACGMVGHILCIASKVVLLAVLIIVNLGLCLHLAVQKAMKAQELEISQKKQRVYECSLVSGALIPVLLIDVVGIICPPASYSLHEKFNQSCTRKALNNTYLNTSTFLKEVHSLVK